MPRWWPFKRPKKHRRRLERVVDEIVTKQGEQKEFDLRNRITVLELMVQAKRRSVD